MGGRGSAGGKASGGAGGISGLKSMMGAGVTSENEQKVLGMLANIEEGDSLYVEFNNGARYRYTRTSPKGQTASSADWEQTRSDGTGLVSKSRIAQGSIAERILENNNAVTKNMKSISIGKDSEWLRKTKNPVKFYA